MPRGRLCRRTGLRDMPLQDLAELGVAVPLHRKRLLAEIRKLQKKVTAWLPVRC